MPRDKGLAQRLREAGLQVREIKDWKNRGSDYFHPKGAVTHHTAGAAKGAAGKTPSLGICIFGRRDLPGPLCNTYLGYDNVVYVVAAGRANHAGIPDGGNYKGMRGNSDAWGLEIEHPGTYPLESGRAEIAAKIQAATIRGTSGADMVVYHKEWAPSRKIDLATAPSPANHRERVAHYLKGGGDEVSVPAWYWDWSRWYLNSSPREQKDKPKSAPDKIPDWAWDYNEEDKAIARGHGMTQGERDWIVWYLGGKEGKRPDVPEDVPDRWWDDLNFVEGQMKL
jgi:hypothetical protein